ncbi:DNA translocase FtsK 4TM domain-containing protein, partial [Francisella orientalis]
YWVPQRSGGILGYETAKFIIKYLGTVGSSFILLITLSIGLILYSGTTWIYIFKNIVMFLGRALNYLTKAKPKDDKDIPDINDFDAFEGQITTTKNLEKNNHQEASISLRKDENPKKNDTFRDVLENTKVDNELSFKDPKKESNTDIYEETISELYIDFDDNEDINPLDSESTSSPQMTKEDLRVITQTQPIVKPLKKADLP